MIDIEKFICSLINRASGFSVIKVIDIIDALNNQGLDYKDGKITKIDPKVEPKFKVGDWVVTSYGKVSQVIAVDEDVDGFTLDDDTYFSGSWKDSYHLWTIQDAKAGDVLCSGQMILLFKKWEDSDWNFVIAYAGIDISGKLQITNGHWLISNYSHPATKEQRDTLFAKMKEAGYEWDAEKKELMKIEQTSAWSEDDERMLKRVIDFIPQCMTAHGYNEYIDWFKALKGRVQPQPKQEWSEEDEMMLDTVIEDIIKLAGPKVCYHKDVDWLKSLKERYTWKPSEGQLECLGYAIEKAEKEWSPLTNNRVYITLKALEEQLKKLKGE